jgi:hypothetical protein
MVTAPGEDVISAWRESGTTNGRFPVVRLPHWSRASWEPTPSDPPLFGIVADAASGWPMRCLSSSHIGGVVTPPTVNLAQTGWTTSWGIPIRRSRDPQLMPPRSIPLRPLPLGLLVCTLAWSPVGFALIVGGGRLRARLRKRRGLCTACGYNITGVTRCPECGVPVA